MGSRRLGTAILLLTLVGQSGSAVIPQQGVWWNPLRPGNGLVLQYQHGLLFAVVFTYDEITQESAFYVGTGELADGRSSIVLLRPLGGSCFWCEPFQRYLDFVSGPEVELLFDGTARGLMTVNGDTQPIRFFEFNSKSQNIRVEEDGIINFVPELGGEWVFVSLASNKLLKRVRFPARGDVIVDPPISETFVAEDQTQLACVIETPAGNVICRLILEGTVRASFALEDVSTTRMEGVLHNRQGEATTQRAVAVRLDWP